MAHHPLWSTITHITYLDTHYLSHVAPHLEMCVPNNEVSQILQNVGNYLLSDKTAHPQRPVFVYGSHSHNHFKN